MTDITSEIYELESFREIAQTYQEVSALRMRRIKNYVLKNRDFLSGLAHVFARVRVSYEEGLKHFLESKGIKAPEEQQDYISRMNFSTKNGRDALVLISANTGLYGDIIRRVFEYFVQHLDDKADPVIVGKVGRMLFEQRFPGRDFRYYDLSDSEPAPVVVNRLIQDLNEYEHVIVFHGKFKDILQQEPSQTSVAGDRLSLEVREDLKKINCIFEPTLEEVFQFFETEIKKTLFEQSIYEASLSKFTSRMVSLDSASSNVTQRIKRLRLRQAVYKHRQADKEKNTVLSSVLFGA